MTRSHALSTALMILALSAASPAAQVARDSKAATPAGANAQKGTAVVSGVVVSADQGRPVRRANVTITGGEVRTVRTAQTDDEGAFVIANLSQGEYLLSATKGGFIESVFGQREPGSGRLGTPIKISAGQQLKNLSIPIARGAVMTGRVLDEVGEPAFGMTVRAYKWVMKSGERALVQVSSGVTDDRGIYRIPALTPGDYVAAIVPTSGDFTTVRLNGVTEYVKVLQTVEGIDGPIVLRANVRDDETGTNRPRKTGFASSYYPGVAQASGASPISLGPGEERAGVDFSLQVVPLAQLSGSVTSPTGPVSGATVHLIESSQPPGMAGRSVRSGSNGRFTFEGVAPGQYVITTRGTQKGAPQLEAGPREAMEFLASTVDNAKAAQIGNAINAVAPMWASTEIAVDGRDQTDVNLILQPGVTITGRIVTDTSASLTFLRMSVGLTPVGSLKGDIPTVGPAVVDASGRFTIKGASPGRYRFTVMGGMPSGYSLASALFAGQDILDIPLEITGGPLPGDGLVTLTTRTTELSGTIQDASGQPSSTGTVIVFPADERFWTPESRRIQGVRPATDGRYQVRNLPPGDYRAVVVADVEPGRWFDPAFLRQLAGFASFTLEPGARAVQDFRAKQE